MPQSETLRGGATAARPAHHWVFAKLYLGLDGEAAAQAADTILSRTLAPEFERFRAAGLACFFIRYHEGGYHLRVRVHGRSRRERQVLRQTLGRTLRQAMPASGRLEFARYEAELEKYAGPQGQALAEAHFRDSSALAMRALSLLPGGRLRLGLQLLQTTLQAAGLSPQQQQSWCQAYGRYWLAPSAAGQQLLQQDQRQFALHREQILASLDEQRAGQSGELQQCLQDWAALIRRDCWRLARAEQGGQLRDPIAQRDADHAAYGHPITRLSLLPNFVHLLFNRMGISIRQEIRLAFCLQEALALQQGPRAPPLRISLLPRASCGQAL